MKQALYTAGIALWACLFLVCCKEEKPIEIHMPDTESELPTDDALSIHVKHAAFVIGTKWDEVGNALRHRLQSSQSSVDDKTRIVLLGSDVRHLSAEQLSDLKKVCDAGGAIGICEPTWDFADDLLHALDIPNTRIKDCDDDNGHFADMFLFTGHGDVCELNDIHDSDALPTVGIDSAGNETYGKDIPGSEPLTAYTYGLYADALAEWLNEYAASGTPRQIRNMYTSGVDLKTLSHAQTQRFVYSPSFSREDTPEATKKAEGRSGVYQVTYTIYAFYSFEKQADYYMVHQEVIGNNAPMFIGTWTQGKDKCYGFYLGCIDNDHRICDDFGVLGLDRAELHDPTPLTSTGSTSITSGYSIDFGGSVGLSTSGPNAGLSAGGSISESYTTSLPDVNVINRMLTDGCNACWAYDCGSAKVVDNGWSASMKDSPLITRHTIVLQNCWYWTVPMEEDSDEILSMEYSNRIIYNYTWLNDRTFSYSYGNRGGGLTYEGSFELTPPNRSR